MNPDDLARMQLDIEEYARDFGLDFWEIRYQMLDYRALNLVAAYDGFPTRYPHWRFGMEYDRLTKSYAYGLHRIYELVINTNPVYAYLLQSNLDVDQKLVMAHVCGHADFFKNNMWFSHTNRKMLDEMANHAARIRRYVKRYGLEVVEEFLDACLSLDNMIDVYAVGEPTEWRRAAEAVLPDDEPAAPGKPGRFQASGYMESFINPPQALAEAARRQSASRHQEAQFPPRPVRDILGFLMVHAPLENWQRDVLGIVREEATYFAPQRQTKIMNEGWASYWHSTIMTRRALTPGELIDYADHHSGAVSPQPGRLNPYQLGLALFRDIEDRWNRGAFGAEYDRCDDIAAAETWDRQLGLGRQKIFEVRRVHNDVNFIDEFLTPAFARKHRLFTYAYNDRKEHFEIADRDFQAIKRKLLFQLTNFGQPIIEAVDANHTNRGELLLVHHHEGIDLDIPYAEATLRHLFTIWGRPVHLETTTESDGAVLFSHGPDGASRTDSADHPDEASKQAQKASL